VTLLVNTPHSVCGGGLSARWEGRILAVSQGRVRRACVNRDWRLIIHAARQGYPKTFRLAVSEEHCLLSTEPLR
jgi:hypothetical protein